ncbi:hypothetical protein [Salinarimonas chemoclinalis]|uniref:hypothetical protein n=1 Tax=Salinarimonas chemoclinalis TaxID=3241599 RepID=UPI0035560EB8
MRTATAQCSPPGNRCAAAVLGAALAILVSVPPAAATQHTDLDRIVADQRAYCEVRTAAKMGFDGLPSQFRQIIIGYATASFELWSIRQLDDAYVAYVERTEGSLEAIRVRALLAASAEGDTSVSLLGSTLGGMIGGLRMADRSSMTDLLQRILGDAVSAGAESQMRRLAAERLSGPYDPSIAPDFCFELYE